MNYDDAPYGTQRNGVLNLMGTSSYLFTTKHVVLLLRTLEPLTGLSFYLSGYLVRFLLAAHKILPYLHLKLTLGVIV